MENGSTSRSSYRGGETISDENLITTAISLIKKRRALLKAILILVFLAMITIIFTYPAQIWYIAVLGAVISASGIFLRMKMLITIGVVTIGSTFFLTKLNMDISPLNIIYLTGFFVIFYACGLFVYEFTRMDIILDELRGEKDELIEKYMKRWKLSVFKYLTLSFLVAMIASMISLTASFDEGVYHGKLISFSTAVIFAVSALIFTFILVVKLPDLYENRD